MPTSDPRFLRWVLAIAALAVLLRLVYCGLLYPTVGARLGWRGVDDGFDELARNLLDGHGYVFRAGGSPNLVTPPGYAFVLTALFAVTGQRAGDGWHLWLLHAFLDGATTALIALYARRLLSSTRAGLLASAGWALYPQMIVYAARPFAEVSFTLLLLLLALATARFLRTGRRLDGVWVGLLWGAGALFKEKLLLLPVLILLVHWRRQRKRGRPVFLPAALMLAASLAVLGPWLIRQHEVAGQWIPITARSGKALRFGLDTDFTGPDVQADHFVRGIGDTVDPGGDESVGAGMARIVSDPVDFARDVAVKTAAFWYWGQSRVMKANMAIQLPLVALALAGFLLWRRRVDLLIPVLFIGYFVAVHAITTVRMRYSLPVMPFVMVLAAAAIEDLLRLRFGRRTAAAALLLFAIAWPAPVTAAPPPQMRGGNGVKATDSLAVSLALGITSESLARRVEEISGERPVVVAGTVDSLTNRYSYSTGCRRAEEFVAEQFESAGLEVSFHEYLGASLWAVARGPGFMTAAGDGGTVLTSEDGGATWVLGAVAPRRDVRALVASGDTLWAVGAGGAAFRSRDRGRTWIFTQTPTDADLNGLARGGSDTLWAVGAGGAVVRSEDGGLSWTGVAPPGSRFLTDVARSPNGRLLVTAFGGCYEADSDGRAWRPLHLGIQERFVDITFVEGGAGWICGANGLLLASRDGGTTWAGVESGTAADLEQISFRDPVHGFVAGTGGTLLHTEDGGIAWRAASSGVTTTLRSISDGEPAVFAGFGALGISDEEGAAFTPPSRVEGTWRNVVATWEGSNPGPAFLLTAHLDSWLPSDPFGRHFGADDNASGIAGLLEAAAIIARYDFERTIRLVAFTGEEEGKIGSAAYASRAAVLGDSIAAVVNLDMIAYDGDGIPAMDVHAGTGTASQDLGRRFIQLAALAAPGLLPALLTDRAGNASDHASFWDRGIPAILVIEDIAGTEGDPDDPGDSNGRIHTPDDRAARLAPAYHEAVTRAAVATVAALAVPIFGPREVPGAPELAVSPAVPNPGVVFRLPFSIGAASDVALDVFDASGRRLWHDRVGTRAAGPGAFSWAGRDGAGRRVPAGVYFYRLTADGHSAGGRVVVAR